MEIKELYNRLTEEQKELLKRVMVGQGSNNIDWYKATTNLKSMENIISEEDSNSIKNYIDYLQADKEERNSDFCDEYGDEWERIQENVHAMLGEGKVDIEKIKDWALKQEEEIVKSLAEKYEFSLKEAREFTCNMKFNFKTDEEMERDRKHEIVEEVYEDYFEHQNKLQYNDYSSIYFLVETLENNWNGHCANLEYDLDIKDNYLYLENTPICPMNQLLCCEVEADSVKYKLKNDKLLYIVIRWIQGNDAFINQIYIQGEDEDDCEILYEKEI